MRSPSAKRTKIVCTIGPASESRVTLTRMVRAGMDVARLNFSHGDHAWHAETMRTIRAVERAVGRPIAILQDLQGPKIRVGTLPSNGVTLTQGTRVTFTTASTQYDGRRIPVLYRRLHADVRPGHRILLDDGLLEVRVIRIRGRDITCAVITGGRLTSHKGMNLPETRVDLPALTVKDRRDVAFGVAAGVDAIALSFVKHAADIRALRRLLNRLGGHSQIIAKVEQHEALANVDAILAAADGIMVARGDLGVEIPAAEVPIQQKEIIERCRRVGKPVIVATQMLDSMTRQPRPTRAEVSDVANAIIDHADAIMLSGESATGQYPVAAVQMMTKIATATESSRYDDVTPGVPVRGSSPAVWESTDIVSEISALFAASIRGVRGILVATLTGRTARRVSRFRPQVPIVAATPDPFILRQLTLSYGIHPLLIPMTRDRDAFVRSAVRMVRARLQFPRRASLIIVLGEPWGKPGTANSVSILTP